MCRDEKVVAGAKGEVNTNYSENVIAFLQRQGENTNLHVYLISTEHHGKRFWLKWRSPVFENCL